MTCSRIYLVGFMGAGKSSVGRILSKRLGWKFLDLDGEIEHGEHQSIADIFQSAGEPHFRKIEHAYLEKLSRRSQVVIALGGGSFVESENRDLAESTGLTVWLKVSFATVAARVKMDGTRPMFRNKEQAEALYLSQRVRLHDGKSACRYRRPESSDDCRRTYRDDWQFMRALFSLLLLLSPLKFETGRFTIYQDGKKIGTEDYTITPIQRGYLVEGHTVIADANQSVDMTSKMELDAALKTTSYEFQSKTSSIKLTVGSPTSELETDVKGAKRSEDVRFPADGFIVDANFFHHYAILLYRVGAAVGPTRISAFVPQELGIGRNDSHECRKQYLRDGYRESQSNRDDG